MIDTCTVMGAAIFEHVARNRTTPKIFKNLAPLKRQSRLYASLFIEAPTTSKATVANRSIPDTVDVDRAACYACTAWWLVG